MRKTGVFIFLCVLVLVFGKKTVGAYPALMEYTVDDEKSGICGDNLNWTLDENNVLEISGTGDMYDYYLYGEDRTSPWNKYNSIILRVEIKEGVTYVGEYAFYGCDAEVISISSTVNNISSNGFENCKKLKKICVNEKNNKYASIDGVLFNNSLTQILCYPCSKDNLTYDVPETVSVIGENAFNENKNITEVLTKSNLKEIKKSAFAYCSNLKNITLCDNLESIDAWAFRDCGLTEVHIPSSVKYLGDGSAFEDCSNIKKIYIDDLEKYLKINSIGIANYRNSVDFYINGQLVTEIVIPDSVNVIPFGAFQGCSRIKKVEIPDGVTQIKSSAFYGCTRLEEINFPQTIEEIDATAFYNCVSLKKVSLPGSIKKFEYGIFGGCSNIEEAVLENGITEVGGDMFVSCINLIHVELPDTLKKIGDSAFAGCKKIEEIKIPDTVTKISEGAFRFCYNLEVVNIPNNVTEIEKEVFCKCARLKNIKLSENIQKIGDSAFKGCSSLDFVIIPKNVSYIGVDAFDACYNIKEIDIKCEPPTEVTNAIYYLDTNLYVDCDLKLWSENERNLWNINGDWNLKHDYKLVEKKLATCEMEGESICECSKCNHIKTEKYSALGHTWDDGEVTTAPTCTASGIKTFACETCGETRTEEVEATGHTVVVDNAVDPTCTKPGLTEGSHCSVCNEVIKAQEEVAALGHTWDDGEITTAPTCTKTGVKTYTCTACGQTRTEDIKATGHTAVTDKAIAPTCTETGLTEGSHCSVCNEVIKAQEEVPALGHTWDDGVITTAPTCTKTGIKTFTCTTCGEIRTEDIKATGHTVVVDEAVAPTCTESGLTEGSHCSVCNEVIKAQEEVAALGHTWDDGEVTTAPTCTMTGVKTFTCTACGEIRTEDIKATGHTVVVDEAVAPTCTEPGLTEGSHCSVCNEVIKAQEEVAALGHTWDDGEITTAPTCIKTGVKTYTCTACGQTRTEDIKATGHTAVTDKAIAPTCTETGLTEGIHCSVCNEVIKAQEEVAALGHKWNSGKVTKKPTYTAKGTKTYTCTVCSDTKTEDIPVLKRVDITKAASRISVAGIENKIYNGKAQTQAKLVVKANGRMLTKGTNYTVTYKNNKNIGTATLTITGKNGYTGTIKKTFAIKTQAGKVYGSTLKYKITSAKTNGTGTVSLIGSGYSKTNKKFTTLKVADTVIIGGVKFKITKIENKAFMKYHYLTNVVVGSNVTGIGDYAFYGCPRLATVTVGKNIRTIGTKAFYGCKSLKSVKILSPKLVKAGTSAFAGIKANAAFALPKKYYNSYGRLIKKAGAPKKAVYKKF